MNIIFFTEIVLEAKAILKTSILEIHNMINKQNIVFGTLLYF